MVYGTAHKPFVLRTLLPTLDRLLVSALPSSLREAIVHLADHGSIARPLAKMNLAPENLPELLVAIVLMDVALMVFVVSLRSLARSAYGDNPWLVDFAPLVALVLVPCCFAYVNYVYDFATLGLFTAGLALMARERFVAYFVVFALACVNKETTILLTLVFGLHFRILAPGRRTYLALAAAQVALFVVVKAGLGYVFRTNPGTTAEFHLFNHTLLFPTYHMGAAMGWLGFGGLIAYGWTSKPPFLRSALAIMVPLVGLTFFLGYLDEIRDYYEAFPAAFLLASETVARIFGVMPPLARHALAPATEAT
jgi:hypothetical protein